MDIRTAMPLLARHEGEWEGVYTYVDPDGNVVDRHRSHLSCLFPDDEPGVDYHQVNTYTWDDGRQEVHDFPARLEDGRIWFDTDRIRGNVGQYDDDVMVLTWVYKGQEDVYLYELIQLGKDGNRRARTWQWFRDGELFQRTLINERRVGT